MDSFSQFFILFPIVLLAVVGVVLIVQGETKQTKIDFQCNIPSEQPFRNISGNYTVIEDKVNDKVIFFTPSGIVYRCERGKLR